MATIQTAVDIDIKVDGQTSVQQAANAYEDLGDAVAKTQRQAEALALQYGINDQRTQDAIKVAAKYKYQLEQLDASIELNRSSMELLIAATNSLINGFQAAIGAVAIFGNANDDLLRQLTKVQGAMAFSEAINNLRKELPKTIRGLQQDFVKLNSTLTRTEKLMRGLGLGVAALAIGYLLDLLDKYIEKSNKAAQEQEELNKQITDANQKFAEHTTTVEVLNRIIQDTTINEEKRKEALNELIKVIPSLNEVQLDQADSLTLINNEVEKYIRNADKQIRIDVLRQQAVSKLNEQLALQAERDAKLREAQFETGDAATQLLDEVRLMDLHISELGVEYDDILSKIADVTSEMELQEPVVRKLKKEVKETTDTFEEWFRKLLYFLKRQDEKAFQKMLEEMGKGLKSTETAIDDVKDSLDELGNLMIEMPTGVNYDKFQKAQLFIKAYSAQIVQDLIEAMEATAALMDAFAGDDEERQRKAFQLNKAAAISKTTLSTIEAVQYAFETAQKNPLNELTLGGYAIARAATALAFGVAQIKKIQSTQFKSSNPGTLAGTGVPQFPAPRTFQASTLGQDFSGQTKVYVTEGDITKTQRRVQNLQRVSVVGG